MYIIALKAQEQDNTLMTNVFKHLGQTVHQWIGGSPKYKLDALLKAYAALGQFSGSALIARGGEVILAAGYGLADREYHVANTSSTRFRIGSMTKPFTALAIMQLEERGKLALENAIGDFVPGLSFGAEVTLAHLLSNTSGIADYITAPGYRDVMGSKLSIDAVIGRFSTLPLAFRPGGQFSYSNSNWVLLSAVIEQVSGLSYDEYIRQHIFAPAGMVNSGADWPVEPAAPFAVGYQHEGETLTRSAYVHSATMLGAGALYSTAEDLLRFDRALYTDQVVRQATLQRMVVPITALYGYGWGVREFAARRVIGHDGGLDGYLSALLRYVDEDVTIILLSNLFDAPINQIYEGLSAIVFGLPYEQPSQRRFVSVDPAVFAAYVGQYSLTFYGRESIVTLRVHEGKLLMDVRGLPEVALRPMSPTTFFGRVKGEVELTFMSEADGRVNTINFNWAGHQLDAKRIG
jgi:CubicO group peptidase (beta-lactamase class C family)